MFRKAFYISLYVFFFLSFAVYCASVHLAWDPPSSGEVDGYRIYYGTEEGSHPTRVDVGTDTEYIISGLENTRVYYFVARAYNTYGESEDSNEVSWCYNCFAEDVNQDGEVNVSDMQLVVNTILGLSSSNRADVNGDSIVTSSDVQTVVNRIIS